MNQNQDIKFHTNLDTVFLILGEIVNDGSYDVSDPSFFIDYTFALQSTYAVHALYHAGGGLRNRMN